MLINKISCREVLSFSAEQVGDYLVAPAQAEVGPEASLVEVSVVPVAAELVVVAAVLAGV